MPVTHVTLVSERLSELSVSPQTGAVSCSRTESPSSCPNARLTPNTAPQILKGNFSLHVQEVSAVPKSNTGCENCQVPRCR